MKIFSLFLSFIPIIHLKIVIISIKEYFGKHPYPRLKFIKEHSGNNDILNTFLFFSVLNFHSSFLFSSQIKENLTLFLDKDYESKLYIIDISLHQTIIIPNL